MLAEDQRRQLRTVRKAERDRHTESVSGKHESTSVRLRSRALFILERCPNMHVLLTEFIVTFEKKKKSYKITDQQGVSQKCHVRDIQFYEISQFPLLNQDNFTVLTSNFNETVIYT